MDRVIPAKNRTEDVDFLQRELRKRTRRQVGVVLKIETRRSFENPPRLLLAGMCTEPFGIMIARGDLAVECGFERLAELQEEILWICEAAHVPVIWATQVLENLSKKGMPTRAEISDAALAEDRAWAPARNDFPKAGDFPHGGEDP